MNKRLITAAFAIAMLVIPATATAQMDGEFTGTFNYGPPVDGEENVWEQTGVKFSDERLDGDVWLTANSEQLDDDGIYRYSFRIETEDGAWQGESVPGLRIESGHSSSVHVLTGEEMYDGLFAVAEVHLSSGGNWRLIGRIMEGPFPQL